MAAIAGPDLELPAVAAALLSAAGALDHENRFRTGHEAMDQPGDRALCMSPVGPSLQTFAGDLARAALITAGGPLKAEII
jgi:hypothetical protein